ncbi:hypothetical protein Aple_075160 [Acrocarpospora pleiomorpha]|uniref:NmrA-like domain-containing protein n=1 Tax=Acrocarpospora pleiomorpha TaxID=90975 RepID=A0A5M3XTP5_9ACTN|nr:NmrA/HSCARG family protein [Acrocarpospora pleiomorpha]GES24617.1 hypothetical protein Aple_075160 [Acrocarpospora pleiomorpha]
MSSIADPAIVAVTGATGRQGGAATRALIGAGRKVRALTRRPESPSARELAALGADVVRCDLGDRESIRNALQGASGLYLTTTPYESGVDEEERQAKSAIDIAREAGIRHVVYGSVASADQPTGVAHFESKGRIEEYLTTSGIPLTTVLRPTFFMDMFLDDAFRHAIARRSIEFVIRPETRIAMIAVDDIAAFAAHAFAHPDAIAGHVIDLAGDYPSMMELASVLSEALQQEIVYRQVDESQLAADVRPKAGTQRWLEDVGWQVDPKALEGYGVPLTDLREWAVSHREKLLSAAN